MERAATKRRQARPNQNNSADCSSSRVPLIPIRLVRRLGQMKTRTAHLAIRPDFEIDDCKMLKKCCDAEATGLACHRWNDLLGALCWRCGRRRDPISLDKSRCDFTGKRRLSTQFQNFALAMSPNQIRSVRSDQVEPGFVEKLTEACCARAAILRIWIAAQFNFNDPFDHPIDSGLASQLVVSIKIAIQVRAAKPS